MIHKITLPTLRRSNLRDNIDVNVRVDWCAKSIGRRQYDWDIDTYSSPGNSIYLFRREEDAVIFSLRWTNVNPNNNET